MARKDYLEKLLPDSVVRIIPAVADVAEIPREYLRGLDALVITGGSDIDPASYGAERSPRTGAPDVGRDAAERALIDAAKQKKLPVLGICRGMQMLNLSQGGDLHQHVPDVVHSNIHQKSATGFSQHKVKVDEGAALAEFCLDSEFQVATFHHQAVNKIGAGLRPVARAEDGIVEAIETEGAQKRSTKWAAVGVQWHPEAGDRPTDSAPFRWLERKAVAYRKRNSPDSPSTVRAMPRKSAELSATSGKTARRARRRGQRGPGRVPPAASR